ncbi:MAG: hypothetical protein RL204_361 [Bacteroidota bacterium]|jgi:hypothetical protein
MIPRDYRLLSMVLKIPYYCKFDIEISSGNIHFEKRMKNQLRRHTIILHLGALIFLSSIGLESLSQNPIFDYYKFERQARIFKEQNQLDSSLVCYLKALECNSECPISVLESALKISTKLGNTEANSKLKTEIQKQKLKFNSDYSNEIKKLFKADQKVRGAKNMRIAEKYRVCESQGNCSENKISQYKDALDEWNYIDSTNIVQLISLISKYGFPSENVVGQNEYDKAHIIMLHFDRDTNNVILGPILDSALVTGKIKPRDYAWIVDRRYMSVGKNPPYFHIPTVNYEMLSAEEKANVDLRRIQIGLGKVAETQIVVRTRNGFKVKYLD